MNSVVKMGVFIYAVSLIQAYTHDEISKCILTGVHRTRQTIIESPNYPNNYKADICWDYVIRSPFKCPTKFHIQFLDFDVEFSKDCKNDYLAIGLENIGDDMDILCGQVVGIKKYHTPDGVLRLRFFADESPWTTGKGFKLLVTRLACEREELFRKLKNDEDNDAEDDNSIVVTTPPAFFQLPESELMQIFRNLTAQQQYHSVSLPSVYDLNYSALPSPLYPVTGTGFMPSTANQNSLSLYPGKDRQSLFPPFCANDNEQQRQLPNMPVYYGAVKTPQLVSDPGSVEGNVQTSYIPLNKFNSILLPQNANSGGLVLDPREQYIGSWSNTPRLWRAYDNTIDSLEACCVSAFQQKRFYLSSPGFPRTIFSNIFPNLSKRDCVFRFQKSASNVCRLRVNLKFFDFGLNYQDSGSFSGNIGVPTIQSADDFCQDDFIEIDNQRFCGCRSGFSFTSVWPTTADKKLRMRLGYSGVPSGGFLLELIQEECLAAQLASTTTEIPNNLVLSTPTPNLFNNQLANSQQDLQISLGQQNPYGNSYPAQQQQQQLPQIQNNRHNFPIGQQILNTPAGFPTYLQQPNLPLTQQQKQPQFLPNNYLDPPLIGSSYFTSLDLQQNLLQPPSFSTNPFGLPLFRYARSYARQSPISVVETNSTRKEYYYAENEARHNDAPASLLMQSSTTERSSNWDREDTNINGDISFTGTHGREKTKCTFDMGDILRLSVDILWITKPICYAPQRNWFTNWIG